MKKFTVLTVILLLLFVLASAASVYFTLTVLSLPEDPEGVGGALGAGLTVVLSLVFVSFAAAIELITSVLSLIGLLLARREGARRGWVVLFAVFIPLPLLVSVASYLLILL